MKKCIFTIMSVLLISSCSLIKEDPDGKWDDNIRLSARNAVLSAMADSVIITTGGDWWWINTISIGEKIYSLYNMEGINLESNSYSIKEDCFVVERRKNALFVKMNKNNTGAERVLNISLEAGDYFDRVSITQKTDGK